jgi:hypothetical protein
MKVFSGFERRWYECIGYNANGRQVGCRRDDRLPPTKLVSRA